MFVGVKAHVVAIDKTTGATLWKTKLKGGLTGGERFVTLMDDGDRVYAHTYGELFCLDPDTGAILWRNELDGLSYDIVSLASAGMASPSMPALVSQKKKQAGESGVAAGSADGGA